MTIKLSAAAAASVLLIAIWSGGTAFAQKRGGNLKMYILDNPPSMSMLDGVNPLTQRTMNASWPRMSPGRSSFTAAPGPAGNPTSRG
jgi:hypothetical protein